MPLRTICLSLPEAVEQETVGQPDFSSAGPDLCDRVPARRPAVGVLVQGTAGQARRCWWGADPDRFFRSALPGSEGLGVALWLDRDPDREEVAALVRRSYRLVAPRRLAAAVG